MSENDSKVVSLLQRHMEKLKAHLAALNKDRPTKMNAVLVDRNGFMKPVEVPYPPLREIFVPDLPPLNRSLFFATEAPKGSYPPICSEKKFRYVQTINGIMEYRED